MEGHKVNLWNRNKGTITGVKDVVSFDVAEIILETELGMLSIKGNDLHVKRLTVEKGEVEIDGNIDGFQYTDHKEKNVSGDGLLSRLFK
ncbi:MAG: sporulation protein YabP [Anaerostipes sp.]|uniref:sporulation protein YabP n=1 Tax=Anaerostipes sp. 992a TaxID=1261637 RepID=UPI000952544F|nr:sporulation protein YabP [Anaerostipes sp. 992a]MCI5952628.1 sporulation protein YabP [Anaerostipes sp.]MDD5968705.1 sporulation protein YabP [Anaerostipes sp.]OLR60935.1 sporulation protein YabP [Anaerostipes sp. 992a]